ncbi:LuxR C-terminal-related transcriptional regulator [Dactylosporangium sucinum]|uniref:HTH luxR-type domain-containing protein n=1 Tax=Dactylosporangium sucinum TaxID=1424081 RepID=A0A917U1J2_9ACTN|nr:LuxR C-terminal-related transcriptional regulator [Dactylosporangium sucinum]GGM49941.1 hypothetical protein GCM10007977_059520 [Dactylosporangium sucinum]
MRPSNRRPTMCASCRGTVKTHLSHIFTKLGTTNRAKLVAAVIDGGLSAGRRVPGG